MLVPQNLLAQFTDSMDVEIEAIREFGTFLVPADTDDAVEQAILNSLEFGNVIVVPYLLNSYDVNSVVVVEYRGDAESKPMPSVSRIVVSRDDEERIVEAKNDDDTALTHYTFRVSRETVYALQSAIRNIVPHYFNDHSSDLLYLNS